MIIWRHFFWYLHTHSELHDAAGVGYIFTILSNRMKIIRKNKEITSCHITWHPITSYRIMSDHIMSYHIISHHITSDHIISYHITSYHIMSHHITHIISCQIISCERWKVLCWHNYDTSTLGPLALWSRGHSVPWPFGPFDFLAL